MDCLDTEYYSIQSGSNLNKDNLLFEQHNDILVELANYFNSFEYYMAQIN